MFLLKQSYSYFAIGTYNFLCGNVFIPFLATRNCFPLLFGSLESNCIKSKAIIERFITNACYTIGDCYARKVLAVPERIIINTCHTVWNYIVNASAYQCFCGFFNYAIILTSVFRIVFIDSYACKVIATIECTITNASNTVTYIYACELLTISERTNSNARNAITYSYTCKAFAKPERSIANARYTSGDGYACEVMATTERTSANACNTIGDSYACKADIVIIKLPERIITNSTDQITL